jgi:hypothetical protein
MKHILLILISVLLISSATKAQDNQNHFNLGLGLNGWGIPVYGSYDWGFRGDFNLGVGASVAFDTDNDDRGFNGTALGVGFFTQWYADRVLEIPQDFDVYAGGGLFYYTFSGGDDLDLNLFIGGRYYFNDKMGFNLEFGGGSALAGGKVGVSWRL